MLVTEAQALYFTLQTVLRSLACQNAHKSIMQSHCGSRLRGDPGRAPYCALMSCCVMQLAIYSEVDRLQPHRYKADESYEVGAPDMTPVQCYLDYEGILALAK